VVSLFFFLLFITLLVTVLVHRYPRNSVICPPRFGQTTDHQVPALGGGVLEVWKIEPEGPSKGLVILAHGWGRNRDRMINRARIYVEAGFTAIVHSARDHGQSSKIWFPTIVTFAEDQLSLLRWLKQTSSDSLWAKGVILHGHSAGSGGAALAAHTRPEVVRALVLEASFFDTKEALISLYYWFHPVFGFLFGRVIVFWMRLFSQRSWRDISPGHLAKDLQCPLLIIHGERDQRFPVGYAKRLSHAFAHVGAECWIAPGADHSDAPLDLGYEPMLLAFLARV
jgi:pimeloyl-ACP methyl ester carboxylesterase